MITGRLNLHLITGAFLLVTFMAGAQSNQLLERGYWKQNPTVQTVTQTINEGNDPAQLNSNAFDPAVFAILENVPMETVKFLLDQKGNDVNKITHDGRTYIFWAAYANNLPLMKYLVDSGAKTDVIDDKGYSVLNFTARSGIKDKAIYDFIFAQGADAKTDKNLDGANALLLFSSHAENQEMTDYFQSKGLRLSDKDNDGNGIFNYAAKGGNIKFLDYLIKEGVDYKTPDNQGRNAMHFASMGMRGHSNSREVFEFLEGKGFDPNSVAKDGTTPLTIYLGTGGDARVVNYFLQKGADPDFADGDGNTALMLAARNSNPDVVRMLLDHTKNINAANKKGQTALMFAIERNTPEVVNLLNTNGADFRATDRDGNNAIYYLVQSYNAKSSDGFFKKAAILEEKGVSLNTKQAKGNTFYHLAAQQNEMELLQMANEKGLDVNAKNTEGLTPLHIAAMKSSNIETLKYLMASGADKGINTDFDESAYQLAGENELLRNSKTDLQFLQN